LDDCIKVSLADSESLGSSLFLGQSNLLFVFSGNWSGLLNNVEFDMAVGGEIWRDSTVSSVSSSSSVDSSLGNNVGNLALFDVETLLLSVRLEVDKESNDVLDGLLWESTVVMADVLAHGVSTWSTSVSSEWNDGFVFKDSLEVANSLDEVEASASSGSLVGVLVMNSEVISSAFSGYIMKKYKLNTEIKLVTPSIPLKRDRETK
jgi:hypothetical protein